MSFSATLNLVGTVQVARESVSYDGLGGTSAVTTLTTLSRAAIWQTGTNDSYLSSQILRQSTHLLACKPGAYTWSINDRHVTYSAATYEVIGRPENVLFMGEVQVVPLKLVN